MSGEDRYGAIEDAEAILAIHRALDAGVNCVDTAAGYGFGHAEEVVGQALAGHRDQVILATKCGLVQDPGTTIARRDISRSNIVREAESSLRRLHTDVIDVYLIHWPTESTPIEEAFQAMDDLVRAGKVRFIGVNTPESTIEHEPYGKEASNYTKSRLPVDTRVWLETDVQLRDRYGRILA